MHQQIFRRIAPAAALAMSLSACSGADITINGEDGVPLAELDMSGNAPTNLVMATVGKVIVTQGDTLDISVDGEQAAIDALRFQNEGGALAISHAPDMKGGNKQGATVRVSMPAPEDIFIAGAGTIESFGLARTAGITIGGSGSIVVDSIDVETLEVTIAGSGRFNGAGVTDKLEVNVVGSGRANMEGLSANQADVTVAGSGNTQFASDGEVDINIFGSGDVTVTGDATCTVNTVGSGDVSCATVK